MPPKYRSLLLLLSILVFSWSLYRDLQTEKQGNSDLRNRIVGARLQEDGHSPYFYKWKKGDGVRYYDSNNFDTLRVSNITASPFFHRLLFPIADLPQHTISLVWLGLEYGIFIIMMILSISVAVTGRQQALVVVTACLFLLTEAWKTHVVVGQMYLFIPFFAMIFYCTIRYKDSLLMAFTAGICAVMLILIRPNTIIFFIPFLFLLKRYRLNYLAIFITPFIIAGIWISTSNNELFFWKQYKENISQQIKLHQTQSPDTQVNDPAPKLAIWEGIDQAERDRQATLHPIHSYSENGNFFVTSRLILHRNPGTRLLAIFSVSSILLGLLVFYLVHHKTGFTLNNVSFAGFCLFMLSDLFSPVFRHQYYTVQWLFPLLLSAAIYSPAQKMIYLLLGAGLLLNIANFSFMRMEHTIGEYIMLIGFIILSLRLKAQHN